MTSEPDSTPRRRPPTIDLTAKEVEPETPSSTQESAADGAEDRTTHKDAPGAAVSRSGTVPAIQNPAMIAPTTITPTMTPTA